jgi:abortive infection bacteriophage resistance protein
MHYNKPSFSIEQQIARLRSRGVEISNIEFAAKYLQYVGYYRLTGYLKNFEIDKDRYQVHFEEVINLYQFDKKLRLLVLDAVETIEIAVKSCITLVLSNKYGLIGTINQNYFQRLMINMNFVRK